MAAGAPVAGRASEHTGDPAFQNAPITRRRAVVIACLLIERAQRFHDVVEPNRPGAGRNAGAASIALASEAHDARIARFSLSVRSASSTTLRGCSKARAGCNKWSRSHAERDGPCEAFFLVYPPSCRRIGVRFGKPPSNVQFQSNCVLG